MVENEKKVENELLNNVYSIYDTALSIYESPFVMKVTDLKSFLVSLANDVNSKYYDNPEQYEVFCLGTYDDSIGEFITNSKQCLGNLSQYVDVKRREIQMCIRTLNYLPTGYFKMPVEMQKEIQVKIDDAVKFYAKEFCSLDSSISSCDVVNS